MIVKLLTEHHLEFLSLKDGCRGSYTCQNATLLETSCTRLKLYDLPLVSRNNSFTDSVEPYHTCIYKLLVVLSISQNLFNF